MLLHPAPLISLLLLIANDHWLKYAGLLPGLVTGKLSDFAGLIVAPLVLVELSHLLRAPGSLRSQGLAASLAVGIVFTLVKTLPLANALYVAASRTLLSPLGWRVSALMDVTDLVALTALAVPLYLTAVAGLVRPEERASNA